MKKLWKRREIEENRCQRSSEKLWIRFCQPLVLSFHGMERNPFPPPPYTLSFYLLIALYFCFSWFKLLKQNIIEMVACKQNKFVSKLWRLEMQCQGASTGRLWWGSSSGVQTADSPHRWRGKGTLRVLSYEGTTPIHGGCTLWHNHLPKVPPPNTIMSGGRNFDMWIWVGCKHSVCWNNIFLNSVNVHGYSRIWLFGEN